MHLELIRTNDRQFPDLPEPRAYATARIWHCRYQTLAPLAALVNLRGLAIATYPDLTFDLLSELARLEDLSVLHMPRVSDLSPLSALTNLRRLELATLPSWDASGKVTEVQSLAPLAELSRLVEVSLFGVRPPNKRVDDLLRCHSLRRARISSYPDEEVERLQRAVDERQPESDPAECTSFGSQVR